MARKRIGTAIRSVEFIPVSVPRHGNFSLHRGTTPPDSPFTIVRITTEDGVTGYGEGNTTVRGWDSIGRNNLAELLVGADALNRTAIHAAIDAIEMMRVERVGHWNVLRAAIDMAVHDVIGKTLGVPVHDLLGGKQRDEIVVIKNVGVGSVEDTARRAAELIGEGYRALKIRVGADVATDIRRVEAVRKAAGPDIPIRVDANQAWAPREAVRVITAMAEYGLEAVEQPCRFADIDGGRFVVERSPVPIISDEGFWTADDAYVCCSHRAADVLHIYLGKCGGLLPSTRIVAIAEAAGAALTVGERVPLGISLAAHCHFAASIRTLNYPSALAYDLNEHDLLVRPLVCKDGVIPVPSGPGLGIEVDEDKLRFYTRDHGNGTSGTARNGK